METWVFNRGPLLGLFWTDRRLLFQWPQKTSISPGLSVFISSTACLSLTLSGSVHWSPCCSLQNTSIGQSGSNCLLSDIKAPKTTGSSLVFWRWSKRRTRRRRRKTSLNSPPCLGLQPFILIPVDTCYFFDGKYKALLGNIRRAFDMREQI